jgi:hypothetical protein
MTAEPTTDLVLGGAFWNLGNLAETSVGFRASEVAVGMAPATVNIPQVRGVPVGELDEQSRRIKMVQLELADRADLLYPNFDYDHPETDPGFPAYCQALEQLGARLPPLHVLPIPKVVTFQGQELPMFAVYDDPIQFAAMQQNRRGEAAVIIELGRHPGELLMQALSRTQHLYRPTALDLCDVAARLASYGYEQDLIAVQMAKDSDTGNRLDQATISRMIAVSRLPARVRRMVGAKLISRSHAELLAVDRLALLSERQEQLANWAAQPPKKTVKELEEAINLCFPKAGKAQGHIEVRANGSVDIIDDQAALQLVSDRRKIASTAYPTMTFTQAAEITRVARDAYRNARVTVDPDGEVCVDPASFGSVAGWMRQAAKRQDVTLHEAEVMAYAWIEALRQDAARQKLLARDGTIAPTLPKVTIVESRDMP